jgi:hypothetical protein
MGSNQIRSRAILAASAVVLSMSLVPTTSDAQTQPTASPIPGSMTSPSASIDALTNNPNGANWLKKFDRQPEVMPMPMAMPMNDMHHEMSHKMMMEHRMMIKRMKKQSITMPMKR